MKVIIDIEANSLHNPTKVWLVVCKCVETGELFIYRELTNDQKEAEAFKTFASTVSQWIGHNILEYDLPVLNLLVGLPVVPPSAVIDTLIISRMVDYSRSGGHSIEQYGLEFEIPKGKFSDWTKYSKEMEDYCVRDVEINERVYHLYSSIINNPDWQSALLLEHRFQNIVNDLHNNGFAFDTRGASKLLTQVHKDLHVLDEQILKAFPPRTVLVRNFTPKATKFGTINKTSVPRILHDRIHLYEVGKTYPLLRTEAFNPSSHKQLIEVLNNAGWRPEDRTTTHIDTERALSIRRSGSSKILEEDRRKLQGKLDGLRRTGWKINENNLSTLPDTAPEPLAGETRVDVERRLNSARLLAQRILLESRRRTLTEWLNLVGEDGRIHGKFVGIGAWTQRMAHQKPNTANIPREFREDGSTKLLGKELRELWIAPRNRLLVGVDAEGIQLRIFAHLIQDEEFTDALVRGKKSNQTDPHSLNQRVLGSVCKTRQSAKRFVYALLLGGGINKLATILGCSVPEAKEALDNLLQRYQGFAKIKQEVIPSDAKRGWFIGLDGRKVKLPGDTPGERGHLAMSGYLQNGEAIIIKKSAIIIDDVLHAEKDLKKWMFVDIVHDELQSEVKQDMALALRIAQIKATAIREAGEYYKLKCPMAGSYWNDDHKDYTIGKDWYQTH